MDEDTDVQRSDRSLKEDSCLWDGRVEQGEKKRGLVEWGHEKRFVVAVVIDNMTATAAILILWLNAVALKIRNASGEYLNEKPPMAIPLNSLDIRVLRT